MISYTDELYHHGIKGQKWGVRRFQNKDGTRTSAGKIRYSGANATRNRMLKDRVSKAESAFDDVVATSESEKGFLEYQSALESAATEYVDSLLKQLGKKSIRESELHQYGDEDTKAYVMSVIDHTDKYTTDWKYDKSSGRTDREIRKRRSSDPYWSSW